MKNFIRNTIQSQKVFYRYFRRKGWKRFLKENILETDGSNKTKALSVALGVFVGLTPFWGFHTVIVIFLASILKLNKILSYMFTHVSAPPFIPFIIISSLLIGAPFVGGTTDFMKQEINFDLVKNNLIQYLIGSFILAISSAVILGFSFFFVLKKLYPNK